MERFLWGGWGIHLGYLSELGGGRESREEVADVVALALEVNERRIQGSSQWDGRRWIEGAISCAGQTMRDKDPNEEGL